MKRLGKPQRGGPVRFPDTLSCQSGNLTWGLLKTIVWKRSKINLIFSLHCKSAEEFILLSVWCSVRFLRRSIRYLSRYWSNKAVFCGTLQKLDSSNCWNIQKCLKIRMNLHQLSWAQYLDISSKIYLQTLNCPILHIH